MRLPLNPLDPHVGAFGRKAPLFVLTCVAIFLIGTVTFVMPLWRARTETLLDLCHQYAVDEDKPWKDGAILPLRNDRAAAIGQLVAVIAATVIGLASWYLLRWSQWA